MKHISEKLRLLRLEKGYSQQYVADSINVSVPTISRMENNPASINLELFFRITEFYGFEIGKLFSDTESELLDELSKVTLMITVPLSVTSTQLFELAQKLQKVEKNNNMQVITIESETYKNLVSKLERIESYVKRSAEVFAELDETLELTSNEVMDTFNVSKATLYRWRRNRVIPFRYESNGSVLYSFKELMLAIKNGQLKLPKTHKSELLSKLTDFKEKIISSSLNKEK